MTTSEAIFTITYDGPGLQSSEMDVRQLAPALHALGDLLDAANRVLNGQQAKVSLRVKGSFKTGSFGIDFSLDQSLMQSCVALFNTQGITAALNIVELLGLGVAGGASLIKVLLWLKSRPITKVIKLDDSHVEIYVDNDRLTVDRKVLELLKDYALRKSLEAVIKDPLNQPGITIFAAGADPVNLIVITPSEAPFFTAPAVAEQVIDNSETDIFLQIVSISFNEENKWRFSDGNSIFYASIDDPGFLSRIEKNEVAFSKGDKIKVRLGRTQWQTEKGTLRSEYSVITVLEHHSAAVQYSLPLA